MCVKTTWYAHMFRTQGGFAFPWGNPGRQQQKAREVCMNTFYKNQWDKQVRPLSWLIERFWNELQQEPNKDDDPKWTLEDLAKIKATEGRFASGDPTKGIIFYTTNRLPVKLAHKVQTQLRKISEEKDIPIVSSSLKPMPHFGTNVHVKAEPGYLTYFKQILAALEASTSEVVFFCEHDNLYHPSHFDFTPPDKDKFYYDLNWWKVREDGLAVHWDAVQVSGLVCYRQAAIEWYKNRITTFGDKFDRKFEPTKDTLYETYRAEFPSIDIRHGNNLTYNKWKLEHFRDRSTAVNFETSTVDKIEGWDNLGAILS